jgi:hypothetical protein
LKAHLTPIPQRAISDLETLLVNRVQMKIDKLLQSLQHVSKEMRQDSKTLDDYVKFCELLKRTANVIPQITSTIAFIERMHKLFLEFGISHSQDLQAVRNGFMSFTAAQAAGESVREERLPSFADALRTSMQELEAKLGRCHEKTTAIPMAQKGADVHTRLPVTKKHGFPKCRLSNPKSNSRFAIKKSWACN